MGDVMDSSLMHINKGNPLSARESKGNPPKGVKFDPGILLTFHLALITCCNVSRAAYIV